MVSNSKKSKKGKRVGLCVSSGTSWLLKTMTNPFSDIPPSLYLMIMISMGANNQMTSPSYCVDRKRIATYNRPHNTTISVDTNKCLMDDSPRHRIFFRKCHFLFLTFCWPHHHQISRDPLKYSIRIGLGGSDVRFEEEPRVVV